MRKFNIIVAILIALLSAGCSSHRKTAKESSVTVKTASTNQEMPFWCELLYRTYSNENSNVCLSPLSAQLAIAMTAEGAEGETQQQMYNTIGSDICEEAKNIMARFNDNTCKSELNLANSIWINDKLSVKEEFINSNKTIFDAEVNTIPFDRHATKKINNWCSDNTKGKIKDVVDKVGADNMMFLINALYLKTKWWSKFDARNTKKQLFTTATGNVVDVDMMKQSLKTQYYIDDVVQIATLPFEEGFEMVFVLPRYNKSIDDAIMHLATHHKECTEEMELYKVDFSVPKFKTEYSVYMRDILYAMGMEKPFCIDAEFGKISDIPLYIDNIIQKTYINIDENGAEAAAVTVVDMRCGALPPQAEKRATMTLDRPFIYAIRDRVTDTMIFIGTIGDPGKK